MKVKNSILIFTVIIFFLFPALCFSVPQEDVILMDKRKVTKTYDMKSGGDLNVKNVSGDVIVTPWNKNKIEIVITKKGRRDDVEVIIDRRGNNVDIEVDYPRRRWYNNSSGGAVYFDIKIPAKTDVEARSTSGDVSVTGIEGKVEGASTSGDIELENITGRVYGHSTSGSVTVDVCSDDVEGHSTSGNVFIRKANGDVDVHSTSGDIEVQDITGSAKANTTSGDIILNNVPGDVYSNSTSGTIEITGGICEGIDVSTTSGDIDVDLGKLVDRGRYEMDTNSGDITLIIPSKTKADITARARPRNIQSDFDVFEESRSGSGYNRSKTRSGYRYSYSSRRNNSHQTLRGEINGGGGAKIFISVNSGGIDLRKR